ncbi:hypothetical protein L207DRAFT_508122 [Hyaloscypha variabilis F]|uniref:DUF1279 domain-containing protein n=1 Tax=Hyaloscypha variabilis (strain UAMH 11265 / GT02V1 / F) TaxID=1149755 RepID=A0A2J6S374_HYAVF|nr:hypothetical protein L207DRAFT_508122 [Hyaloscypha variabilis F]
MLRTTVLGARGAARLPTTIPIRSSFQRSNPINTPLRSLTRRRITSGPQRTAKRSTSFTFTSHARPQNSTLLQRIRSLRFFHNTRPRRNGRPSPDPTPNLNSGGAAAEAEPQSLGARMRKLSREYGWSALGVYFALTALDFPFCYLFVRQMGTDKIGEWEHVVVSYIKQAIPQSIQEAWHSWRSSMKKAEGAVEGSEGAEPAGWGVEEADARNKREASLATQLALAYAIHKSFIFIRVPITISITPKVVRVLRGWGWDIGKRTTKEARAIKRATIQASKPPGKR